MHIHLEPVGGIAGDMFCAAMLDAFPHLEAELMSALDAAGLLERVEIALWPFRDHALSGRRFEVRLAGEDDHAHRSYPELCAIVEQTSLDEAVKRTVLGMFERLAVAESRAHGIAPEEVHFHEVGGWDSIIDVTCAAWLVQRLQPVSFSVAAIPIGSGRIRTAHGVLPVPAPASVSLLEGLPVFDDGIPGERVTPTGAAILQALEPTPLTGRAAMLLRGHGIGFGSKRMPDISNMLRVLVMEPRAARGVGIAGVDADRVLLCEFEVDDQTAEDLAVALARLLELPPVRDVVQWPVLGKKGRMAAHVQVLAEPDAREQVIAACLEQTSTLGVRWRETERALLKRESGFVSVEGHEVGVKRALRPSGQASVKAEMDDLARHAHDRLGREALRRAAETPDKTGQAGPGESGQSRPAAEPGKGQVHDAAGHGHAHHHHHHHHHHHAHDGEAGGHSHPSTGAVGPERVYGGGRGSRQPDEDA